MTLDAEDVAIAAQLACLLEVSAPKPGNVSPGAHFRDARYEDWLASAAAIGPALALAGTRPLGKTVLDAVSRSARWTTSNTNLGIVLLLAPLARAATTLGQATLRERARGAVEASTVEDAIDVYAAIRRANPGGLGRAGAQDVAERPTVTLLEAMSLAADRDGIAREYVSGFATLFEIGAPALARARRDGLDWDAAVVECYLVLLAAAPDTHIARKLGTAVAAEVSRRARSVLEAGAMRSPEGRVAVADFDRALRDSQNTRNPGTTADLTAATIFVALLEGGWRE
jgi:triphosphoribosyl-dephospho-CoA synthase